MNTTKAIEFLMEEPEIKTKSRLKLEHQFFLTTKIRWKKNIDNPRLKHLVLHLDESDGMWSNGLLWLTIIHENMIGSGFVFTIEYTHPEGHTTMTSNDQYPDDIVYAIREQHIKWYENQEYRVMFDGVFDVHGMEIEQGAVVTVVYVTDDSCAVTDTGHKISVGTLIDGDIIKI